MVKTKRAPLALALLAALMLMCAMASAAFANQAYATQEGGDLAASSIVGVQEDPIDISAAQVTAPDKVFTHKSIRPDVKVVLDGKTLVRDTDFKVAFTDNVNAGKATITVTGLGNYTGQAKGSFTIKKASASRFTVATIPAQGFTGKSLRPLPNVKFEGYSLSKGVDYTLSYTDNVKPGVGKVKITATAAGNYLGSKTVTFTIKKGSAEQFKVAKIDAVTYSGTAFTPNPKVTFNGHALKKGTDYKIGYSNNTNAGIGKLTIMGINEYTGRTTATFRIMKASLQNVTAAKIGNKVYYGTSRTPMPNLQYKGKRLKHVQDYAMTFTDNIVVGTAKIAITGKGNFKGKKQLTFKIVPAKIGAATVTVVDRTYTGKYLKPVPTAKYRGKTLANGKDFTLSYKNNVNAGAAQVILKGIGNFTNTKAVSFTINPRPLSDATLYTMSDRYYTGDFIRANPKLVYNNMTLQNSRDYTLSYSSNKYVGTATVYIVGKGNYTGQRTTTFDIVKRPISSATVASIGDRTYTGSPIEPNPLVTFNGISLVRGTDYTVSYSNNVYVGTATITFYGTGNNFTGSKSVTFNIVSKPAAVKAA